MTVHRKRTPADWIESEFYLSDAFPPSRGWEATARWLVLVVLACLLVAWLVWGGRG